MPRFLNIRTEKFPILEGEAEEIINPGTYGKSFTQYVEATLKNAGFSIPFIVCEDWGWWVEVALPAKTIGITCYREHEENRRCNFSCAPSVAKGKVWSWRKFRRVDLSEQLAGIRVTLLAAFTGDPEIEVLEESEWIPWDSKSEQDGDGNLTSPSGR
jgi:hypothetical protein